MSTQYTPTIQDYYDQYEAFMAQADQVTTLKQQIDDLKDQLKEAKGQLREANNKITRLSHPSNFLATR
jgi:hypothetical protein